MGADHTTTPDRTEGRDGAFRADRPSSLRRRRRRRRVATNLGLLVAITLVAGALVAGLGGGSRPGARRQATTAQAATATSTTAPHGPLSFRVDPSLAPEIDAVAPATDRGRPRPVGVLAGPDGYRAEFVLDEVILHADSAAELDAFLARWHGEVLDSFAADVEGQDHLVRVDASRANPATLAVDLLATERHQRGEHRVSDERALRLLALAAAEWRDGTEVVIDWLTEPAGITDGEVYESGDITNTDGTPKNVFDWTFMRAGGAMDIGVGAAWQLLEAHGTLAPSVRYMVVDGGFSRNFDFPDNAKIRKADWGDTNPKSCTNGAACPWHGTDVVLAAMGTADNSYGTAGPAGPVVSQLIAVGNSLDYWSQMRRIERMAEKERPDVVNLSFGRDVTVGGAHAKKWTDRRMRHTRDTGALIVAAAGNNGRSVDTDTLWVPCESTYVICVGGIDTSAAVSDDSNYGEGDSSTSVEIYGPMCVRSINDPNRSALDFTTRRVCGTSVSSPFVGGVAALVMAADPRLGPEEVRGILNDTANVGGLGAKVTGSQRRVNALAAVARALGVDVVAPEVAIESPDNGDELGVAEWVDLRGAAIDFMGRELELHWESDVDGALADGADTSVPPLSHGTHVLTASATDSTGRTAFAQVTVEVVDTPPDVDVVSPPAGLEVYAGNDVALTATTLDPDTWSAIDDADTRWEVLRNGAVVHTATGHQAVLPSAKVTPGDYVVRFTAAGATAEAGFHAMAVPPGQTQPVAIITAPSSAVELDAYNGAPQPVSFAGTGTDAEDGALAGARYRWVAHSSSETKVLCEGSNVPHDGGLGLVVQPKSCESFTGELGLGEGDIGSTTWSVWLEVYDSTGLVATDSVTVRINYVTG